MDKLLEMETSDGRFSDVLALSSSTIDALGRHHSGMDVYFPVENHRISLEQNPEQNFLVGYFDGALDDQQEQQFLAWDRNGNSVALTSEVIPEIPVLVIIECEHGGQHVPAAPCPDPCGGGTGGSPSPRVFLKGINFKNVKESWWRGNAEIEVFIRYADDT